MNEHLPATDLNVVATYDAASDYFDLPELDFWNRHGRKAAILARLQHGARVLDVGCGTGASALPAARAVGPEGHVTGLDMSEGMLTAARAKAKRAGLRNVSFECADMRSSVQEERRFDAVISVFSLFFVPEMEVQIGKLWRLLKPGGRLVVTVWGRDAFQPFASFFGAAVEAHGLPPLQRSWERLTEPESLSRLLTEGGATAPDIHVVSDRQPLAAPEDWWTIAMGSGFRWEIDQLSRAAQQDVRERVTAELRAADVDHIPTNAIHAVSVKRS